MNRVSISEFVISKWLPDESVLFALGKEWIVVCDRHSEEDRVHIRRPFGDTAANKGTKGDNMRLEGPQKMQLTVASDRV